MFLVILLLLTTVMVVYDFIQILKIRKRFTPFIKIISIIPLIGSIIQAATFRPENLHLKFAEFIERYGKTFASRVFGSTIIVTADQIYIEKIIGIKDQHQTRKHVIYLLLRKWLGNGLLLSDGEHWQNMRKIIMPTFHVKILEHFVEVFERQSRILVANLKTFSDSDAIVDIYPYMCLTTLDVIVETTMGVKLNAQDNGKSHFVQAVNSVTKIMATRFMNPHLAFLTIFRVLKPKLLKTQNEGIDFMHQFTEDIIQKRRATLENTCPEYQTDEINIGCKPRLALLDVLLKATINGEPLTDKEIRDEVNTFMFAGHDTTTTAISFCLYLISRHPECQGKLFEEIRTQFGNDLQRPVTYHDLLELQYLTCVIKESLRLYPPVPAIGRWIKKDIELPEVTLPAGANVIILIWQLLRDAEYFEMPLIFRPERHLEEQNNKFINNIWIPFSAGPRNCIGQRFALLEMKTIIINVLRHYQLLRAGDDVKPSIKIVLKSETGVNFGLTPRIY